MRPPRLDEQALAVNLERLSGWDVLDGVLQREFIFESFAKAMSFMAEMAVVSERLDHHPTWTNTYQNVQVQLSTHDAGGLTELDFQWAEEANRIADR